MSATNVLSAQCLKSAQRGTTLIEVLVTLVLISVGLLGVAALQLTSLRSNQEAYVRSQASVLAADILDRMRTNQKGVRAGQYAALGVGALPNDRGTSGTPGGDDMAAWQDAIDATLPGGAPYGEVGVTPDGRVVTVTISWAERGSETSAATKVLEQFVRFSTRTEI